MGSQLHPSPSHGIAVFEKQPMGWDGMGWDCPIPLGALNYTIILEMGKSAIFRLN